MLLHITSLPSGVGNGDLGRDAYGFIDFMVGCGLSVWQTLPIGPPHGDGSPYQCMSAHAGNPLLINLEWLVERGWLKEMPVYVEGCDPVAYRLSCLNQAFESFESDDDFIRFAKKQAWWLDDFCLFVALREEFNRQSWQDWPEALRDREPKALADAKVRLSESIARVRFEQFVFFQQWKELRAYANQRGVILFGDMPIFVACDSADVWAARDYFDLNSDGQARVVAGVPPDYFSETGQRWGNPHYNWAKMKADKFRWWQGRMKSQLELYDWVRIDHFRGFEAFWEIPSEEETAMQGRWVKAPGAQLLKTLIDATGGKGLPLVAENLGVITPEVEALRERFAIPGMLILQFAFDGGPSNPYLPHNHSENNVIYTGTHDNDTSLSWYESLSPEQKAYVYDYLGNPKLSMPWALIQSALASVSRLAMLPMQDLLELDGAHRMNTPGTMNASNWRWRFSWDQLDGEKNQHLAHLIRLYGRAV